MNEALVTCLGGVRLDPALAAEVTEQEGAAMSFTLETPALSK